MIASPGDSLRHSLLVLLGVAIAMAAADASAAGWIDQRQLGPFLCRAEFPLNEVEPILDDLARLQSDLIEQLRIRPAREPIEIYLLGDRERYAAYIRRYLPEVPYRRALYVKQGGPGMVFAFRGPAFEIDLRHECTHALLHATLPWVPLWLDEGLAEYFELPFAERAFQNPHLGNIRWMLRFGRIPQLHLLEQCGEMQQMQAAEYRDAWAWVHFLLHGPSELRDEFVAYLADIERGSPTNLLSERLTRRDPHWQNTFAEHFRAWKP
jgi:hypothetical protein